MAVDPDAVAEEAATDEAVEADLSEAGENEAVAAVELADLVQMDETGARIRERTGDEATERTTYI